MNSTYDENVVDYFRISRVIDHLFDIGENGALFLSNLDGIATGRVHHVAGCSTACGHPSLASALPSGRLLVAISYRRPRITWFCLTHQGHKLLVRSFEFDEQRLLE